MDNMQRRLEEARTELLNARTRLAFARQGITGHRSVASCEAALYRCLDRAWEAQCMAQGSL